MPLPEPELRLADRLEAAAGRDMYAAAPPSLGLEVRDIGGATVLIAPTIPVCYFNRAIGLGVDRPAREADLDAIAAAYRAAGVADFWIHRTPGAQPEALDGWLDARGFTLSTRRSWAKFLRAPQPPLPVPASPPVRRATIADGDEVGEVVCRAYGMPPLLAPWIAALIGRPHWQMFVGELDGRIVAAGALHLGDDGAWLGVGATLASYRGRGAQTALLAARIGAAAQAQCEVAATETGEPVAGEPSPSLANIRRAGFRQVASRLNYAAPRPA